MVGDQIFWASISNEHSVRRLCDAECGGRYTRKSGFVGSDRFPSAAWLTVGTTGPGSAGGIEDPLGLPDIVVRFRQ